MAFAKLEHFDPDTVEMAAFASALAHPARIALLQQLIAQPDARCADIVEAIPLSQPSCSRHLAELRKADLVSATQQGGEVRYHLNCDRIAAFCDAFQCTLKPETP